MRFWIMHSGEVSIQDQIVAQVSLGVLCGELAPGEKLPSVRELARRFQIHANTVSLAYRRLEKDGWLESRRGSGMYVRQSAPRAKLDVERAPAADLDPQQMLRAMMRSVVQRARALKVPEDELRRALEAALSTAPPASFLLVEPDAALERIVLAELAGCVHGQLRGHRWPGPGCAPPAPEPGTLVLTLPSKAAALRAALPAQVPVHVLRVRSVPQSLEQWLPAPVEALVGVASHWPPFLEFARTMLVAAGFAGEALLLRDANQPGWQAGLTETDGVVCDTCTASLLPAGVRPIPFRLLADEAAAELRRLQTAG